MKKKSGCVCVCGFARKIMFGHTFSCIFLTLQLTDLQMDTKYVCKITVGMQQRNICLITLKMSFWLF